MWEGQNVKKKQPERAAAIDENDEWAAAIARAKQGAAPPTSPPPGARGKPTSKGQQAQERMAHAARTSAHATGRPALLNRLDRRAKPPAITPGDKKDKTPSEEAQWRDAIERAKSSKR